MFQRQNPERLMLKHHRSRQLPVIGLASAIAFVIANVPAAMAQDAISTGTDIPANAQIEEITITATKNGATALQRTPLAVSTLSAAQLDQSLIIGTRNLAQYTPNLQAAQNNQFAEFYIRGVGSNNVFNGSDPDVTVNIDGVYVARPFAQFADFLDVERVEVLRGPQGTLYGRNAVGGTINIISRQPTDDYQAAIRLLAGAYAEAGAAAYVSGALVAGKADFSLSGTYYRHDAYRENIVPDRPNIDNANRGSARFQLRLTPQDDLEATTRINWTEADEAILGTSMLLLPFDAVTNSILGNYHKVAINGPDHDLTRGGGIAEDIAYTVDDSIKLRSLSAYGINDLSVRTETDGSDIGYQITNLAEKDHQFSQEFTASGSAGKFDYVGGLYYSNEGDRSTNNVESHRINANSIADPAVSDYNYAAYANINYHLTDALTLIVGDRYTVENKKISQYGGVFSFSTNLNSDLPGIGFKQGGPSTYSLAANYYGMTPKGVIQYQLTEDIMVYASVTRGFKSGGFNQALLPTNPRTELVGFAPEKLTSYEGGAKTQWLDRRLRFNVTGFHYDYSNLQVQAFLVPGQTSITNAATATIDGVEFETEAKPLPTLDLGLNLSVLDAKYQSYPKAPSVGLATIDASGHYLNEAPPLSMNMWGQHDWNLSDGARVWLRAEYSWQDRIYFTVVNDNIQTQGPYGLANLLAGWNAPGDHWGVSLYAKNIFDKQYITQSSSATAVPAGHAGPPQTYGVAMSWRL
jgi:iron complex outermembrane receptor protein